MDVMFGTLGKGAVRQGGGGGVDPRYPQLDKVSRVRAKFELVVGWLVGWIGWIGWLDRLDRLVGWLD